MIRLPTVLLALLLLQAIPAAETSLPTVDTTSLQGKILCGYQGWFRCPNDAANLGWIHWSRDSKRIAPDTLSFELWPDMTDYSPAERFPAPGFTYPDGKPAELFSSDNAKTVLRHFEWMRDSGLDGAWLQHFLVDLPDGNNAARYPTRMNVVNHVRAAAQQTGRVWAFAYDLADMPIDRIYDVLTRDWKKMVDAKTLDDPRYLHHHGMPVVLIWGFYYKDPHDLMTPELANKLIDFFKTSGPYQAFLVGGGTWNWRTVPDPEWQKFYRRFEAYVPWNVGNFSFDDAKVKHATTNYWADDKRDCESRGALWIPTIYPGFSWDNLAQQPPGTSIIPRRRGEFLWEQFVALRQLNVDSVYVSMFDEVDEGTAIFKVTSTPPTQGHFVGYEGLPSDWYLRLTGAGIQMLRSQRPPTTGIPIKP